MTVTRGRSSAPPSRREQALTLRLTLPRIRQASSHTASIPGPLPTGSQVFRRIQNADAAFITLPFATVIVVSPRVALRRGSSGVPPAPHLL